MAHGQGTFVLKDNSKYTGNWRNDIQHGYGEEIFSDGSRYEGNYFEGDRVGYGRFTWNDGSFYEGNFEKHSIINGIGIYHWNDGKQFKGEWKNNKMHGTGIFNWKDGKQYIGEYKFDKKEGYGRYIWNKETYYEGYWKDGKQHGQGLIANKEVIEYGHFRFGKLTRDLKPEEIDSFKKNDHISNDLIKKIVSKFKGYDIKPSKDKNISTYFSTTGNDSGKILTNTNYFDIKNQYQTKNLKYSLGERHSPRII